MSVAKKQKVAQSFEFSAGPGVLPQVVKETAAAEMVEFQGSGRSLLEMSHRGKYVSEMAKDAEARLRDLLKVPDSHAIIFVQGGATAQFSAVPLNLARSGVGEYLVTGGWGQKAVDEAKTLGVSTHKFGKEKPFNGIPPAESWNRAPAASYLHYTSNETVHGVEFHSVPDRGNAAELVCDMSSNFLSRPVDVSKYGLIYAGAQKNCGVAGTTIVIVKKSLLGHEAANTPVTLKYKAYVDANSMYNTPPVFAIYMCRLVFKWIQEHGGVEAMERLAIRRSGLVYDAIAASNGFYTCPVAEDARSRMNVVFRIKDGDADLEAAFIKEADEAGLHTLAGHRSVKGVRASLYNAMPMEGAEALVAFMKKFAAAHA